MGRAGAIARRTSLFEGVAAAPQSGPCALSSPVGNAEDAGRAEPGGSEVAHVSGPTRLEAEGHNNSVLKSHHWYLYSGHAKTPKPKDVI